MIGEIIPDIYEILVLFPLSPFLKTYRENILKKYRANIPLKKIYYYLFNFIILDLRDYLNPLVLSAIYLYTVQSILCPNHSRIFTLLILDRRIKVCLVSLDAFITSLKNHLGNFNYIDGFTQSLFQITHLLGCFSQFVVGDIGTNP